MQNTTARPGDHVRRFIFENQPVRGHWVQLESAWRDLRAHSNYPPPVSRLLGEAVAASVLLAATLKFRGTLTFQLQGKGAVSLLVAQCSDDFRVRAVARYDQERVVALGPGRAADLFRQLVGDDGRITVTVEAEEKSMRYQGIVPLTGNCLAQSLESYFASSEQLPTRVLLAAGDHGCGGLLVQKLPGADEEGDEDVPAWQEAQRGIEQVSGPQVLSLSAEEVLVQSFTGQDVRLFRGAPVRFECRCSSQRVAGVLKALGAGEIRDLLREQGSVTVTCEFCQRPYRFDSIDIEALFTDAPRADGAPAVH